MILGHASFISQYYLPEIFTEHQTILKPEDVNKHLNAIIFWGGEDIATSLYYEKPVTPHSPEKPTKRDIDEANIYRKARALKIPVIGICRGSQLLNVLNGGSLHQHVVDHVHSHAVYDQKGFLFNVTSTHHQAWIVNPDKYTPLAWAKGNAWPKHKTQAEPTTIHEIGLYPYKTLICQGHPEYPEASPEYQKFIKKHIQRLLK